jgi:hypothetical protein
MAIQIPSDADANGGPMSKSGDGKQHATVPVPAKHRYRVTPAVIAAHRANAKKSTGPRSAAGKQTSRRNALTHGLAALKVGLPIPKEEAIAYQALEQAVLRQYPPLDPIGEWAVRQLIEAFWRSRRIDQAEATLIRQQREILSPKPSSSFSRAEVLLAKYLALYKKLFPTLIANRDEMNEEVWKAIQEAVAKLRHDFPNFVQFADAKASLEMRRRFESMLSDVLQRLDEEQKSERLHQLRAQHGSFGPAPCLTPANAFLVEEAQAELIFRYTGMNDRRILMLRQLIAHHTRPRQSA